MQKEGEERKERQGKKTKKRQEEKEPQQQAEAETPSLQYVKHSQVQLPLAKDSECVMYSVFICYGHCNKVP